MNKIKYAKSRSMLKPLAALSLPSSVYAFALTNAEPTIIEYAMSANTNFRLENNGFKRTFGKNVR
jgi:hypothetical protein